MLGPSWPWSYGSWIYNYLCNQCLLSLMLWVRISIFRYWYSRIRFYTRKFNIFVRNTLRKPLESKLSIFPWQLLLQRQPEPLNRNESGRFGALKSDSTHHFFRNACTKSVSLRFSQFSGCWLILSVYIIMSFEFPFVRLFGVR